MDIHIPKKEGQESTGEQVNRLELILRQDEDNSGDEIDLSMLFMKLIEGRKTIYVSLLAALMLSVIVFAIRYTVLRSSIGTVSTVVSFDFEGLKRGVDPYGDPFDVTEIKKAEVIDKAIEELGFESRKITVEDIRRNITISGIIPKDVMDRILIIKQMAEKDPTKLEMLGEIKYVATQYKVDFNIEKKSGLDSDEAKQLLRSILSGYRDYFIDKYSDKYMLSSAVSELDITRYDYAEIVMLTEKQLSSMRGYVAGKNEASPNFRAKSTGLSFGDILASIDTVSNVDLNRVQSLVYTFNLSKDPVKLSAIYENHIKNMEKEAAQKRGEAANTRQVIEGYEKDTSLMMIGGEGREPLALTNGSSVYDSLVKQANDSENEAVRLTSESAYYRTLIARLTGEETTDTKLKEKYTIEVQEELKNLLNRLGEITALTNETVDSYFETEVYSNAVKVSIEPISSGNISEYFKRGIMMTAIAVVMAMMLSVMYLLVRDMFKGSRHTAY